MTARLSFEAENGTTVELDAKPIIDALWFYGDPGTYFAVAVWGDPPTGGFDEDIDDDFHSDSINRAVPGKLARSQLRSLLKAGYRFGDPEETREDPDPAAGAALAAPPAEAPVVAQADADAHSVSGH